MLAKFMDNFVEYALILVLVIVALICLVALFRDIGVVRSCSDYADRLVKDVPARCLEYFSRAR